MKGQDILREIGQIHDGIIEETSSFRVKKRLSFLRTKWIAAACLCIAIAAAMILPMTFSEKNGTGNFSHKMTINNITEHEIPERTEDMLTDYTEAQLFNLADIIVQGEITASDIIEVCCDDEPIGYYRLLTIKVGYLYKGQLDKDVITVLTSASLEYDGIDIWAEDSDGASQVGIGTKGIFLACLTDSSKYIQYDDSIFHYYDVCDAMFIDGVRIGFIDGCDGIWYDSDAFTSLHANDWDDVTEYVRAMTSGK